MACLEEKKETGEREVGGLRDLLSEASSSAPYNRISGFSTVLKLLQETDKRPNFHLILVI